MPSNKKITFNDKENAVNLSDDNRYTLTAEDINEIKDVVNSLSEDLQVEIDKEFLPMKFARFIVPSTFSPNASYKLLVQMSKTKDFASYVEFDSRKDKDKFFIFEDDIWKAKENDYFTRHDAYKTFVLELDEPCQFGRYAWLNVNYNTSTGQDEILSYSQWRGFSFSSFEYSSSEFIEDSAKKLRIVGEAEVFGGKTYKYVLKKTVNGEESDVLNFVLESLNNAATDYDKVIFNKSKSTYLDVLTAKAIIDGEEVKASLPIIVRRRRTPRRGTAASCRSS